MYAVSSTYNVHDKAFFFSNRTNSKQEKNQDSMPPLTHPFPDNFRLSKPVLLVAA